jgi:hypothetical protein
LHDPAAHTATIVAVPEAEVLARLSQAIAAVPAFDFRLAQVACFEATAHLVPEPAEPFVRLTKPIVTAFPGCPPFGGAHAQVVAHLTVAHGDATAARATAAELGQRLQAHGPIVVRCDRFDLVENSIGRWCEMHALAMSNR